METAAKLNSPVIIQFSNGGAQFFAGKGLSNENEKAAIKGGIAGAKHVHELAEAYGATVILHTDHAAKKLLPWIDGLLDASEKHFAETGKPLYSSHMIDLSEEPIEENIENIQYTLVTFNDLPFFRNKALYRKSCKLQNVSFIHWFFHISRKF